MSFARAAIPADPGRSRFEGPVWKAPVRLLNLAWLCLVAGGFSALSGLALAGAETSPAPAPSNAQGESAAARPARWYRGATHVHTLWSDGDAAPEMVAAWYRDRGFDFVALSDHDALQVGDWWFPVAGGSPLSEEAVAAIEIRFGPDWPEFSEVEGGGRAMRLKTHAELVAHFDAPEEFLLLPASEITTGGGNPHVSALNLRESIPGVPHESAQGRVLQRYLDELDHQAARHGVPMLGTLNHLNWGDGLPARKLLDIEGLRFFEVYNGSDERGRGWPEKWRPDVERIWDIVLSLRLLQDPEFRLYGVASDDAHQYSHWGSDYANPGRGWVAVRSESLSADDLIRSMHRGDFYSSTGVELADVHATEHTLEVSILGAPGVRYTTEFIGTTRDFDAASEAVTDAGGEPVPGATRRFEPEIGRVLQTTQENPAVYRFRGDELYVRARVRSDLPQPNPIREGDLQTAWTQPVSPGTPNAFAAPLPASQDRVPESP